MLVSSLFRYQAGSAQGKTVDFPGTRLKQGQRGLTHSGAGGENIVEQEDGVAVNCWGCGKGMAHILLARLAAKATLQDSGPDTCENLGIQVGDLWHGVAFEAGDQFGGQGNALVASALMQSRGV